MIVTDDVNSTPSTVTVKITLSLLFALIDILSADMITSAGSGISDLVVHPQVKITGIIHKKYKPIFLVRFICEKISTYQLSGGKDKYY